MEEQHVENAWELLILPVGCTQWNLWWLIFEERICICTFTVVVRTLSCILAWLFFFSGFGDTEVHVLTVRRDFVWFA